MVVVDPQRYHHQLLSNSGLIPLLGSSSQMCDFCDRGRPDKTRWALNHQYFVLQHSHTGWELSSAATASGGSGCCAWSSASCGPQQLTSPCQRLPKQCSVQPSIRSLFNCLCFPKHSLWRISHFIGCKQTHTVLHSLLWLKATSCTQRLFLWPSGSFILVWQPKGTLM